MKVNWWLWNLILCCCAFVKSTTSNNYDDTDVVVLTVATNQTDGFKRFIRSTVVYGFKNNVKVLGMGTPWLGGDMAHPGGGYKINLLKKALEEFKDDTNKIVLFTDSYDVIFLAPLSEIVRKFKSSNARMIFSAEKYCWPDKSLAIQYPNNDFGGEPYLNSGGFIGYASDVYEIITSSKISHTDDDQLFFTKIYLNSKLREKHQIKLDHNSNIFQNLHGAIADVELRFKGNDSYLHNTLYNTIPLIVHGNGLSKQILNSLGNYLANAWTPDNGCLNCDDEITELATDRPDIYPPILMAIFVTQPTPFLKEFFYKINHQNYPKSKIHIFIYNSELYHEKFINQWMKEHGNKYISTKMISPKDDIDSVSARNLALNHCLLKGCSGYFSIDSVAHLDNKYTLKLLVEQQRGIVAPLLVRPSAAWSNFWGAVADNGYYARSSDYMDIIENKRRGLWNVPYINNCYLINSTIISNPKTRPLYAAEDEMDPDIAFCMTNRQRDIFMYVSNRLHFGHLVNPDHFMIQLTNPDLYEIFTNKYDWEKRYIHENYYDSLRTDNTPLQPCPDVYWFPIVTKQFTKEFIEIMEAFGKWSDGTNQDNRLQGGYENVPTRDIHMNQVNYEAHWLYFLNEYVRPLQERVFIGYYHDPVKSIMNFVVRYKPDEQPSLRPHHDSSTYTINIALNRVGVDYEGGGCHFLRYNCSVVDTKPGWMLMHPGRLTHYHEGLRVTKGTRYIMISFIDP
ncbi:hypothetical protein PV327_004895 [Microctonus hyperodae]|uniref:Fe2OG dioxygenase domain-containing protein n=1 Tax=Microctonus hyperodae TaxID=165561 RepID=A0AA39FDE5_MICHY|nr:hypothetical protein PV327_004895 [Microctonus hyperodae]